MKDWAWLLPCWVWKYFFAQLPRERVLLDGRTRFLIRLDEDFVLVYDPQRKAILSKSYPSESKHPAKEPARVFVPSKSRARYPDRRGGSKFVRTCGLRDGFGVGTQSDYDGSMGCFIHPNLMKTATRSSWCIQRDRAA